MGGVEPVPNMKSVPAVAMCLILACIWETARCASAEQAYFVVGKDSFSIGAGDIQSEIAYSGSQSLSVTHKGSITRLVAKVRYTRSDGTASTAATGEFVADVLPSGETLDSSDRDPDYLSVLNQPFAAQLDPSTLSDLRTLSGTLPFDVPSPFTGSSLHGYLEHIPGGTIGKHQSVGVRFEAAGSMKGELPDRPGLVLTGTISMRGTAYYDPKTALLLALDTTVTIAGTVSNRADKDPVTITYQRTIKAAPAIAPPSPKPDPTPT